MAFPVEPDDSSVVDPVPAESTVPEASPARRSTPVVVPPLPRPERQRRSTVASPIPAMLAASMRPDGQPVTRRAQALTSQEAADLLADEDTNSDADSDYVVEIDQTKPG